MPQGSQFLFFLLCLFQTLRAVWGSKVPTHRPSSILQCGFRVSSNDNDKRSTPRGFRFGLRIHEKFPHWHLVHTATRDSGPFPCCSRACRRFIAPRSPSSFQNSRPGMLICESAHKCYERYVRHLPRARMFDFCPFYDTTALSVKML